MINPEQDLWRAVISRALEDAGLPPTTPDNRRWRDAARHWLRPSSSDFRTVCDLADVSPSRVLREVPR